MSSRLKTYEKLLESKENNVNLTKQEVEMISQTL